MTQKTPKNRETEVKLVLGQGVMKMFSRLQSTLSLDPEELHKALYLQGLITCYKRRFEPHGSKKKPSMRDMSKNDTL